jgi:hypothetical protein
MKPRVGNLLNEINAHFKRPVHNDVPLPVDNISVFDFDYNSPIDTSDSIWSLEQNSCKYCATLRFSRHEVLIKFIDILFSVHKDWTTAPKLCVAIDASSQNSYYANIEVGEPGVPVGESENMMIEMIEDIINHFDDTTGDSLEDLMLHYHEYDIEEF